MRRCVAAVLTGLILLLGALPAAAAAPVRELVVRVGDPVGQPLAGAALEVYGLDEGLVHLAQTGADGTARIPYDGKRPSLWMIRASAKGYRTAESGWFDPARGGVRTIWLEPVGGDLQVLVRSETGEQMEAEVTLLTAGGRLVAQERTVGGRLVRTGLPAGEYRVVAAAEGHAPAERTVSVSAGRTTLETLTLERGGVTAAGEVVDAQTLKPVAGARVELLRDGEIAVAEVTTAPTGRFSLSAPVSGGTFRLRVTAPGYAPAVTEPEAVEPGAAMDFSGRRRVELSPLTGAIEGILLDRSGRPLANTKVVLLRESFGEVASGRTGSDGGFRFDGLAAGEGFRYQVVADEAIDMVEVRWQHLVLSDWVPVRPGATTQVSAVAQDWYDLPMATGSITGRVVTPAGLPVEGATVELIRHTRVQTTTTTDAEGRFTFASVEATEKNGVSTAPYMIRVHKDGFVPTREVLVGAERRTTFSLVQGGRVALEATLRPAEAELVGRVIDRQGRPVAGATVTLELDGQRGAVTATTDELGRYRLRAVPSQAAAASLRVTAPGYLPVGAVDVTDSLGGARPLPTIELTPRAAVVEGVVVNLSGKPVSGVTVALRSGSKSLAETTTDAFGHYEIKADLTAVDLALLSASRAEYTSGGAVLTGLPRPGERARRDLLLQAEEAVVEGRVLDQFGQPVADAVVELLVEGSGIVSSVLTGPDGSYRLTRALDGGAGWVWLRVRPKAGTFAGSVSHGLDFAPLTRLMAGERLVVDLLVRR